METKNRIVKSAAGRFALLLSFMVSGVLLAACERKASRNPDPQEIVIGVVDSFPALEESVKAFNEGDYGYHATIRDYGGGTPGQNRNEVNLRLQADILSSQAPDLFFLDMEAFSVIAERGALEDLLPFLSADESLSRDAFIDGLLELYTTEDGLYGIPRWVSVQSLWGGKAFAALDGEWNVERMLDFMRQYPDVALRDGLTREYFLFYCLGMISKDTWSKQGVGEASPLKEILQTAYGLPEQKQELSLEEQCELLYQGKLLFLDLDLVYLQTYLRAKQWNHGEPLIPIGYPAWDSPPKVLVSPVNGMLAIPKASARQEGAWKFLSLFADGSLNRDRANVSDVFPTTKKEWDAVVQETKFKNSYYERETLSEEEKNLICVLVGKAAQDTGAAGGYDYYGSQPILEIIAQEAQLYFQDARSLEKTLDVIERRCRLYLEE